MPIPPLTADFLRTRWSMVWIGGVCQGCKHIYIAPLCKVREQMRERALQGKPRESKDYEHFVLAENGIWHMPRWVLRRAGTRSRWIAITPPISHLPPVSLLQTLSHGLSYWYWSSIHLAGASESWDMANTPIQIFLLWDAGPSECIYSICIRWG